MLAGGSVVNIAPADVMLHVPYDRRLELRNDLVKLFAPYHADGLALAVDPAKTEGTEDLSRFQSAKISVEEGSLADRILVSAYDHKIVPNIQHFRRSKAAFDAFSKGETDAVFSPAAEVEAFVHTAGIPAKIMRIKTEVQSA